MKRRKAATAYIRLWLIECIIANAITFLITGRNFNNGFYVTIGITNICFFLQYISTLHLFTRKTEEAFFLNMPRPLYSNINLIIMVAVNNTILFLKKPVIIEVIVSLAVIGAYLIWASKLKLVAADILDTSEDIKKRTFFMQGLTAEAEACIKRAKTEESRKICTKLYEEIRYSDPLSNQALEPYESEMGISFQKFKHAVAEDNLEEMKKNSYEFLVQLETRNKKCRMLKNA